MCVLCDLRVCAQDPDKSTASLALAMYLTGHPGTAMIMVGAIYKGSGRNGIYDAITGWCDAILARMPGYESGAPVYLMWEDINTGQIVHAGEVSPHARWAGQIFAARAACDEDTSSALFSTLPAEEEETAEHLNALLQALSFQVVTMRAGGAA